MALKLDYPPGATPIDPGEAGDLIPRHLATQRDLNEWEQANITQARRWLYARRRTGVLDEGFCRDLHRRMFDKTWRWAGAFRRSDKNIGGDWRTVAVRLKELFADTQYWVDHKLYELDETATRFHHRLVSIHPFANGNGRHAREMTDALLREHGAQPFSWGRADLVHASEARARYLAALRAADQGDYRQLKDFVRS